MRHECPMPLRTCVIRTLPASVGVFLRCVLRPARAVPDECSWHVRPPPSPCARDRYADRRRLDAALARDLLDRRQLLQPVHRRAHHVVRVRRAQALRQDVGDAGALHHGAHRTTGDHAGARRRRLHQHLARAVLARRPRAGSSTPVSGTVTMLRRAAVDRLADRFGDFVRLAGREADLALAVADGDERVEREAASALHDLRDAIDRDHVLDRGRCRLRAPTVAAAATATPGRHRRHDRRDHRRRRPPPPRPPRPPPDRRRATASAPPPPPAAATTTAAATTAAAAATTATTAPRAAAAAERCRRRCCRRRRRTPNSDSLPFQNSSPPSRAPSATAFTRP